MTADEVTTMIEVVTLKAAADLGELDRAGLEISEKRLVSTVADAVRQGGDEVTTNRHLPVPNWDPRPGGTDLIVGPLETPVALVELKVSRPHQQPGLHETLWDALKLASQLGPGKTREPRLAAIKGAFLIVAAPVDQWQAATRDTWHLVAREFFPEPGAGFSDATLAIFDRQRSGWEDALWGGRGRPLRIGEQLVTRGVAVEPFSHQGLEWELRCAQVLPCEDEPLALVDEWPVRP